MIQFDCECGQPIRAKNQYAGKMVRCPRCQQVRTIPLAAGLSSNSTSILPERSQSRSLSTAGRDEKSPREHAAADAWTMGSVEHVLSGLFVIWGILVMVSLLVAVQFVYWMAATAVLVTLASGLIGALALSLLFAKRRALTAKKADWLFGLARIVAWDPTEGVLILKDKVVTHVDDNLNDGGGIRLLWPIFGQELAFRAPLEILTLNYGDQNVLTREYVPLSINATIYWRIVNIERFYLLVSRQIHTADDRSAHGIVDYNWRSGSPQQLEAAEQWLRFMAEEQTRGVVAHVSTGLLVAEDIASALPPEMQQSFDTKASGIRLSPTSSDGYQSATNGLSAGILSALIEKVHEYGIEIHRVALQEVSLPKEIRKSAIDACTTAYLPIKAQRDALRRKMELQAEADVIGAENVGMAKVIGSAQPFAFAGGGPLGDFLDRWLAQSYGGKRPAGHPKSSNAVTETPLRKRQP